MDREVVLRANRAILAQGGRPALSSVVLLGLSQTMLHTPGWLASASFQATRSVLAQAALCGAQDDLVGWKPHIVIGKVASLSLAPGPTRAS